MQYEIRKLLYLRAILNYLIYQIMIKSIKKVLLGGLIITTIMSCKKGENDPFISVRSRDARITGTWKLTSMESTEIETQSDGSTSTTETSTTTYDGTYINYSGEYFNPNTFAMDDTTYSYTYTHEMNIEKDGTYSVSVLEDGDNEVYTSNWNWMDSKKKKTSIYLDSDGVFTVDRLTNKELVITYNTTSKETSADQSSYETTNTFKMTFEKQK